MGREDCATPSVEHEAKTCLSDESGSALVNESRFERILDSADDAMWMVPAIALREKSEKQERDDEPTEVPSKEHLECHHCECETEHRFHMHETLPGEIWSGQPIWECQVCGACHYGPEMQ